MSKCRNVLAARAARSVLAVARCRHRSARCRLEEARHRPRSHEDEIAGWAISVRPDGQGLPPGRGTVGEGEPLYVERCAACHGEFGESAGRWPILAGGNGSLASHDPVKSVGSYWPYASTLLDYIRRSMPFGAAQSLSNDELYAITAYVLYLNDVIKDFNFELNDKNFATIRLPNEVNFIDDDRETSRESILAEKSVHEELRSRHRENHRPRAGDRCDAGKRQGARRWDVRFPTGAELPISVNRVGARHFVLAVAALLAAACEIIAGRRRQGVRRISVVGMCYMSSGERALRRHSADRGLAGRKLHRRS